MSKKIFVSGDEAVAEAFRLAKPHVISAYPITPQTVAVERISDFVEDGTLKAEYLHVESEHSCHVCSNGSSCCRSQNLHCHIFTGFALHVRGASVRKRSKISHSYDECQQDPGYSMGLFFQTIGIPFPSSIVAGSRSTARMRRKPLT